MGKIVRGLYLELKLSFSQMDNSTHREIPSKWKNPSGKWHLGLKSLYKPSTSDYTSEKLSEIDCIVWFNGEKWCACIETFRNLKNAKILTNFRDSHEFGILCLNKMELSYCVTLHNEGNLLEIFTPYSDHGSVVAQIAAAHFPRKPERNGLAPGAQIIYMNTTHPETGNYEINYNAFKKAILKCAEMKVDIINYSCNYIG
uniref:Peptidase S8/S53 domain-containing protein n=1 Tax=Panagrolaimus davidi TaxID=227884 RepID=A0A914QIY2_9BILA